MLSSGSGVTAYRIFLSSLALPNALAAPGEKMPQSTPPGVHSPSRPSLLAARPPWRIRYSLFLRLSNRSK